MKQKIQGHREPRSLKRATEQYRLYSVALHFLSEALCGLKISLTGAARMLFLQL